MTEETIWQYVFLGNTIGRYGVAVLAFLFFAILFHLVQSLILGRLEKLALRNKTEAGDAMIHIIESIKPPFYYFISFYLALKFLTIDESVLKVIHTLLIVWVVYEIILCIQIFIDFLVKRSMGKDRERDAKSAIGLIKAVSSIVLWLFGLLFIFSNLGINITSLVAGLGIGGIAFALAIQNILKDLFSSFAIYFDKPFSIGDYIAVGELEGVVKQIGIKTTRLQALQGEEIVISNQELTSAKIKNFSKLKERRVIFNLKIDYGTSNKKLESIPALLKEAVSSVEGVKLERINLVNFDKSGVNYEVVYFIESNKYTTYLDTQEKVLLSIKLKFDEAKINLA